MGLKDNFLALETIKEPLPINPLEHGYDAETLRNILDGRNEDNQIREAINDIIELLSGTGGAAEIGTENCESVQERISELALQLSAKVDSETLESYAKTDYVNTQLGNKVDKEDGKGLSTNDFTDVEKTKLQGIKEGAEMNTVTKVCGVLPEDGNIPLTAGDIPGEQGDDNPVSYWIDHLMQRANECVGHGEAKTDTETGVHGLRFHNGVLEVYSGDAWQSTTAQLEREIEAALDGILAIENSLIGGEGA